MKLVPPVENLGVHDFWTGPMDHVQCLWVSPGSLFTLQSPSRWSNLNTWAQPATKPQYLDTSVHVQQCSVQCTWLNRHRLSLVETIYSLLCPSQDSIGNCVQLCVGELLYVHDSMYNCVRLVVCPRQRQQQYRWCAIPLSGLNCPLRGTKYLPSENPISKRAANPNWWRRWRGEVELLYIKSSSYPWWGNYNPSVAQRVHWCVCTWGREPGFISQYASKQKHKRFTFVPSHCQTEKKYDWKSRSGNASWK